MGRRRGDGSPHTLARAYHSTAPSPPTYFRLLLRTSSNVRAPPREMRSKWLEVEERTVPAGATSKATTAAGNSSSSATPPA
jgi:hypothetical protein